MKLLFSPTSAIEAEIALRSSVDVIDIKNPAEGSLGCPHPSTAQSIAQLAHDAGREVSIAIGDLHHQPGTAAMAAMGAAILGPNYVKAGLLGSKTVNQASQLLRWIVESVHSIDLPTEARRTQVVACSYADYQSNQGLSPQELVSAAAMANCDYVMLDTLNKDGRTLFDHLTMEQLHAFVDSAPRHGLRVALAGSLRASHLPKLRDLQPDLIGVRGAICENQDRGSTICPRRTQEFVEAATALSHP